MAEVNAEAARIAVNRKPFVGRIATVSNERQKDDQSVRSRLAALGFKDETVLDVVLA